MWILHPAVQTELNSRHVISMYLVIYALHVSAKAEIRNGDCLMWPRARSVCGGTQLRYCNTVRPHKSSINRCRQVLVVSGCSLAFGHGLISLINAHFFPSRFATHNVPPPLIALHAPRHVQTEVFVSAILPHTASSLISSTSSRTVCTSPLISILTLIVSKVIIKPHQ